MSTQETPDSRGTAPETEDWVKGEGGPNVAQGGMMPGGGEMENWKKTVPNDGQAGDSVEEQGDRLAERLDGS
jgi:hypothetical protein